MIEAQAVTVDIRGPDPASSPVLARLDAEARATRAPKIGEAA